MKALRIAGLVILSLILFLSPTVFGLAFTLNRSVLNADSITSEVNKLQLAPLAEEFIVQLLPEELPEDVMDILPDILARLEPRLQDETGAIIHADHDYVHGRGHSPDLASLIRSTFLSPGFIVAVIDEKDEPWLSRVLLEEVQERRMSGKTRQAFEELLADQRMLADMEPWTRKQAAYAAYPIADYLVGRTDGFSISVSFPEQVGGELSGRAFVINEAWFLEDLRVRVVSFISEAETVLAEAREEVGGYVRRLWPAYILSIIISALLIAAIVLICRQVKGATRTLGIVFLASGLVMLVGGLLGRTIVAQQVMPAMHSAPAGMQVRTLDLLGNALAPLQWLGIGIIVSGIALMVVYFVYKSRDPVD